MIEGCIFVLVFIVIGLISFFILARLLLLILFSQFVVRALNLTLTTLDIGLTCISNHAYT
jgi:hypothetical protein